MIDKDRIRDLLGSGLSVDIVATTVGCDHSYVSQLMSDAAFKEQVVSLRAASLTANSKRDRKIDALEDKLLDKLDEAIDMVHKPRDIAALFALANAAKRRGVPAHESLIVNNNIVNLNVPVQVVQQFTLNTQGEVIEAEGQTLVTMPAVTLLKQLANDGDKDGKYAKVSKFLPAAHVSSGS